MEERSKVDEFIMDCRSLIRWYDVWLTKIMLPTGKLLIDRTKEDKNVMTFQLGSLDPDELAKHKVMLIQIKEVTQK